MSGIFICYRRDDAEGWAGRLSDSLKAELGRVTIFRDIENIPPGVEFDKYINDAVGSCDLLIALIGPRWLTVTDKNGVPRLNDPNDFSRIEIVTALRRNVRVIPALVGGAAMPNSDDLSDDLKPLTRRQAFELSDSRWQEDCRKLAAAVKPLLPQSQLPRVFVAALLVAIVIAGSFYGYKFWHGSSSKNASTQQATPPEKPVDVTKAPVETRKQPEQPPKVDRGAAPPPARPPEKPVDANKAPVETRKQDEQPRAIDRGTAPPPARSAWVESCRESGLIRWWDVDTGQCLPSATLSPTSDFWFKHTNLGPEADFCVDASNKARYAPSRAGAVPWQLPAGEFVTQGCAVPQKQKIPCMTSEGRFCEFEVHLDTTSQALWIMEFKVYK